MGSSNGISNTHKFIHLFSLFLNLIANIQRVGKPICRKEALVTLPANEDLAKAIEIFGSGIHRVLVTNSAGEVIGVLSQLRLVEFFWNEGVNFRVIDELYPKLMRDLDIGSQQIIAVR